MSEVNEKDWKLLQKDALPSERFWELEKRLNSDKKCAGVYVVRSRSRMFENILNLAAEKAITIEDLEGFSDDIKTPAQRVLNDFIE